MAICEYEDCNNEATHYDMMDSQVCEECMIREIEEGADPEDFESICEDA